jgi:hypothetical protein
MSLKFGDAKRDAEIQRARTAPAQTTPNPEDFVPLDYVSADKLDGDMVDDASGAEIGRVTDVTVARDGAPTEIAVELNEGGKVQVAAASLRYNPGNRTLLTTADAGALKASTQAVAGADAKR